MRTEIRVDISYTYQDTKQNSATRQIAEKPQKYFVSYQQP